jgi:hypothetical protein
MCPIKPGKRPCVLGPRETDWNRYLLPVQSEEELDALYAEVMGSSQTEQEKPHEQTNPRENKEE